MLDYKHEACKFKSGKLMQLDVFIPTLSLAFEYQGQQHYKPTVFGNAAGVEVQQNRVSIVFSFHFRFDLHKANFRIKGNWKYVKKRKSFLLVYHFG